MASSIATSSVRQSARGGAEHKGVAPVRTEVIPLTN